MGTINLSAFMPTANLAINKSRIKLYEKHSAVPVYYLEKGQEFQIELYNPKTTRVLIRIKLNGKYIYDGGLVLRPGERVFLDRYLDDNKRFLFDTYKVKNTKKNKEAIKDNGDVEIEFYDELIQYLATTEYYPDVHAFHGLNINPSIGGTIGTATTNYLNVNSTTGEYNMTYTSTNLNEDLFIPVRSNKGTKSKSIETGRVEKGTKSNQTFEEVNANFNSFPFHTITYKLLPLSQRNVSTVDVRRQYCVECGSKVKASHKYCANCGKKQ